MYISEFPTNGFIHKTATLPDGEEAILIIPDEYKVKWGMNNLIFRSSIWRKSDGKLISASFQKFFNNGESEFYPAIPQNVNELDILEKIDGSALILSWYNGEPIIRTRGTFSAYNLDNGEEIDFLKQKYPKVFNPPIGNDAKENVSFIYEWGTPTNKIIIPFSEPELYLIGAVYHSNYSLYSQISLDILAKVLDVKRPTRYQFNNLDELVANVKEWEGKEGVCVYYNNGQNIRKIKGDWYLKLHYFKSNLSLKSLLALFFELGKPNEKDFREMIVSQFDYECLEMADESIVQIYYTYERIKAFLFLVWEYTQRCRELSKKEFALLVKGLPFSWVYFMYWDAKEINDEKLNALFEHFLGDGEN